MIDKSDTSLLLSLLCALDLFLGAVAALVVVAFVAGILVERRRHLTAKMPADDVRERSQS